METIAAACITGVFGILIALFSLKPSIKKIQETLASKEHADERALDGAQTARKEEHKKLSKEHRDLSKELNAKHKTLSQGIRTIRETQIQDIARRTTRFSQLDNAQQTLANSASMIGQFSEEFARLAEENRALQSEAQQLKAEIIQLREALDQEGAEPEFE